MPVPGGRTARTPAVRSAARCTFATGTPARPSPTYPKKIATERVRALLTQLDDPGFTNPRLGRESFRVYAEKWFAAQPVMASTKQVRSYLDAQLLPAFGDVPLTRIDRFLVQEWIEGPLDPTTLTPGRLDTRSS